MVIEKMIKENNFKLTKAREELLTIFQDASRPLSYEDVKDEISMDKATFYRNVAKFEEAEMLNSFQSNDKKTYYELKRGMHAHFICNNCNKIECIEIPPIELEGYEITDTIFKGRCKECGELS